MPVLGTRLTGIENELLGAVPIGVHVHEDLQPDLAEPREAEVGRLDRRALRVGERDAARGELLGRVCPRLAKLLLRDHSTITRTPYGHGDVLDLERRLRQTADGEDLVSHVVCVGLATRDTVLAVPRHPAADEVVLATDVAIAGGGPAATAGVTLARLRVQTYFVGAVGDDEAGAFIRAGLESEGVDVSELAVVPGRRSPQSAIYVGPGTRAIAAFLGDMGPPRLTPRAEQLCRDAAWVHVDQTGYGSVTRDVRLSIDAGIPVDGLDLAGTALYAPTETGLERDFGTPEAALAAGAELVVVTRGARGCTAHTRDGEVVEAIARPLDDPVSTLGAGDVFHGALLAALVRSLPLAEALGFANRAAALSCRALDGRSAIPTLEEVE